MSKNPSLIRHDFFPKLTISNFGFSWIFSTNRRLPPSLPPCSTVSSLQHTSSLPMPPITPANDSSTTSSSESIEDEASPKIPESNKKPFIPIRATSSTKEISKVWYMSKRIEVLHAMATSHEVEEVKLLGAIGSPFVSRVQIALNLKKIEYQYVEENMKNKSDQLLRYNPVHKKIPVLVHNEKPISESLVILEYIDEIWKNNPILPSDPHQRALARFWSKFIDDKIFAPSIKLVYMDETKLENNVEESLEGMQILKNELKEKFFEGEEFGFVDIAAVYIAFWIPLIQDIVGLDLLTSDKFPKLYKWSQEFLNHPVVKQVIPPRDPLFAYFKAKYESNIASKKDHE